MLSMAHVTKENRMLHGNIPAVTHKGVYRHTGEWLHQHSHFKLHDGPGVPGVAAIDS